MTELHSAPASGAATLSAATGTDTTRTTADTAVRPAGPRGPLQRLTYFRRSRPFWGCLILSLGAYFIAKPVMADSMSFYTAVGVRGITPMMIAGGMVLAAGVALVAPAQRHFPALVATMLSVASLPLANLGGWIIGMTLGIIGSGLIFAWAPYTPAQLARFAERDAERDARRAARARHSRKDAR